MRYFGPSTRLMLICTEQIHPVGHDRTKPFGHGKTHCTQLIKMQEIGGARRDRTDDLLLAKQALSQLSYGPYYAAVRDTMLRRNA